MAMDEYQEPHFALLPLMAQSHMIPMVDIARLLAERGAIVTILTTPHNGKRFQNVIDRAIDSQLNIRVVHLKFPIVKAGLPEGCENFYVLPSMDYVKFFVAVGMLKGPVREIIKELEPRVNCLIADRCFTWVSMLLKGCIFFELCFMRPFSFLFHARTRRQNPSSDFEYFVVSGLPDRMEITKAQLRESVNRLGSSWSTEMREQMRG